MQYIISAATLLSYLLFYTAYSKETKKLEFSLLLTVFTCGKSVDHTLVELNKAISLAGMTVFGLALMPPVAPTVEAKNSLLFEALVMLTLHSIYSNLKYYGGKNIPPLTTFPRMLPDLASSNKKIRAEGVKKASVILGSLGQMGLWLGYFEYVSFVTVSLAVGLALGVAHFYTMEIDYKGVLQVRPWAYIAFPISIGGVIYALVTM
mmetsp:Transcript_41784/g.61159  ORF Transcript_41784/g.61159 Transcript_41784/m.61159 type:complete len:206 (+) Transcript_41784:132-749(+)